jgi:hypothetical protein
MFFKNYFECKFCLQHYGTRIELISHIKRTHNFQSLTTAICTYRVRFFNFDKFLQIINPPDSNSSATVQYKCTRCEDKIFVDYRVFKRHVHYLHFNHKWTCTCGVCGELFTSITDFKKHKKIDVRKGAELKPSRKMPSRAKLMLTVGDSDDDDIPLAKRLKKQKDFVKSQRCHPTNQNKFVCNICRKTFAQKSVLTNHKWIVHRGNYIFYLLS